MEEKDKMVFQWIALGIFSYFCFVILIPLLIFPGFLTENKIKVSPTTKKIANNLKKENKEKTLVSVFDYTRNLYTEEKYKFLSEIQKHFYRNIDKIVHKKQFLPCNVQNTVLITLLISTGQFKKEDFKRKFSLGRYFFNIHMYYLIKVKEKIFKADPFKGMLKEVGK